jgi:hypothetical protein
MVGTAIDKREQESVMPAPLTVKVDLGISTLITKLDEINERRKGRTESFLLNVRDDTDAVDTIVAGLDTIFIDLAQGYTDRGLVDDSDQLRDHIKATQDYLYGRDLVPKLIGLQGFLALAANNDRLRSKSGAPEKVTAVAEKVQRYLESLNYMGPSGIGYQELTELKTMAENKLQGNALTNDIITKARQALQFHSFTLSAELQRLTGEARGSMS